MTVENGHKELIQTIEAKLDDHFKLLKEDDKQTNIAIQTKGAMKASPQLLKAVMAEENYYDA